jgi:hypothetical protein
MDLSRELVFICAISFIISLYLVLLISVEMSNVTGIKGLFCSSGLNQSHHIECLDTS